MSVAAGDKWQVMSHEVTLEDCDIATWQGRRVGAILGTLQYKSQNAVLGAYKGDCEVIGYLIDGEFNVLRDPVEMPCSDEQAIADWKMSHQFDSGWNAK